MLRHSEWSSFKSYTHARSTENRNSSAPNPGPQFRCSLAELMKSHRYYFVKLGNLATDTNKVVNLPMEVRIYQQERLLSKSCLSIWGVLMLERVFSTLF